MSMQCNLRFNVSSVGQLACLLNSDYFEPTVKLKSITSLTRNRTISSAPVSLLKSRNREPKCAENYNK